MLRFCARTAGRVPVAVAGRPVVGFPRASSTMLTNVCLAHVGFVQMRSAARASSAVKSLSQPSHLHAYRAADFAGVAVHPMEVQCTCFLVPRVAAGLQGFPFRLRPLLRRGVEVDGRLRRLSRRRGVHQPPQ